MLAVVRSTSGLAAMEPKSPAPVLVPKRTTKPTGAVGDALEKSDSSDVTTCSRGTHEEGVQTPEIYQNTTINQHSRTYRLTQRTSSNAASSMKGRAEMCCDSAASLGTLVDSARPLLHMITSRLEFTVTGMGVYVGTCSVWDKARGLTDECWSGTLREQQLQRG